MKIAIKANPTRGKEIISLLESLGGNTPSLSGDGEFYTYYIDENNVIRYNNAPKDYKVYTLEEFETQFPFKVGDLCIYSSDIIGEDIVVRILGMTIENDCIMYEVGHRDIAKRHSYIYKKRETLRPYKEMNTRNITLTLEKAKEWYKKGGELKEIALQAFTEKELNPLPRSWAEFCINHPVKFGETYIGTCAKFISRSVETRDSVYDRYVCPSKKSAEAHLAMIQLEQLRDCWRQGWKPTKHDTGYQIIHYPEEYSIRVFSFISFLSFPTKETAEAFLKYFRDLIEKAGDLI